jgi:dipeptidyl aminopeptidase/acylaminoacyl peptidase
MGGEVKLEEKYERFGWPAVQRPDRKPPEGWSLALINSVKLIYGHQLSPDGRRIAFNWHREAFTDVYVLSTAGGWPTPVTLERGPTVYWMDSPPQWSPDGRWLATTIDGHVCVVPSDGSGLPQKITDFTAGAWSPAWMPDSHGLIVTVERHEVTKLLLTDRDGRWPRALTEDRKGDDTGARPSPDGRFVAFVHRPFDDLNRLDLNLVEVETGHVRHLVGAPRQKSWSPRWSPDGRLIAYISQRPDFNEVWLVRPDGTGLRRLTHLEMDVGEIAWSPDSRSLAATVNRGGAMDLALIDVGSGESADLRVGKGIYASPHWSPDGSFLTIQYEDATVPPDLYRIDLPDCKMTQLTFSNPPALACHQLVLPEVVSYRSYDDLEILAFLYRPAKPNGAAILRPHGGPADQYRYDWDILAQYFIAKGYTFIAPNFRGSTGYGVGFEHANYNDWGVGDTQDCLHGAKFLGTLDWIDPDRVGVFGSSYGGYMVACCLARDPEYLFACGVSKYGDANLYSSWAQCERDTRLFTEMQIGHPVRNWRAYEAGSPILQVDNIQKPVLLLHGLKDDIVPPQSSEEWAEAMRRAGKTFEYKTYAGEPHGFLKRETEIDWQSRTERFFDWYLRA